MYSNDKEKCMNNFVIKTEYFKDVCSKILTAVDSTEVSIVTETLELTAKDGWFMVEVTNREYFASVKIQLEGVEDFRATVNATLFLKLISQITTESIEMYIEGNSLVVCGNGKYKLPLIYDGEELLSLPRIEIDNVTKEFSISSDILNSILYYNSKEMVKGTISKPIHKLYYIDEFGAITYNSGACVNSFTLDNPVKLLLNNRLVKLFKLFKGGDVSFTLGYDSISEDIIQTKVKFENANVVITAIISCDDTLLNSVPVEAIRKRANNDYPYYANLNKSALIQAINRLTLFNNNIGTIARTYGTFEFKANEVVIYDAHKENNETIKYANETSNVDSVYELKLNLADLKATLETCNEEYLCIHFGDSSAVVISRGNVKNVIPEVKLG